MQLFVLEMFTEEIFYQGNAKKKHLLMSFKHDNVVV